MGKQARLGIGEHMYGWGTGIKEHTGVRDCGIGTGNHIMEHWNYGKFDILTFCDFRNATYSPLR